MKKFLTALLSASLIMGISAAAYTDVNENDWFFSAVSTATQKAWFSGYDDGSFLPQNTILRGEAAKVLSVYKYGENIPEITSAPEDISGEEWYAPYAALCAAEDIIPLNGSAFDAQTPITRQDAMYAMSAVLELEKSNDLSALDAFSDRDLISDYAKSSVAAAVFAGIVSGFDDDTVKPLDTITRAQFATIMMNAEDFKSAVPTPEPTLAPTPAPTAAPQVSQETGKNLFDGQYINNKTLTKKTEGETEVWAEGSNSGFYLSGYCKISPNQSYFIGMYDPAKRTYVRYCRQYAFYDKDKKFLSGGNIADNMLVVSPTDAEYMRFSIQKVSEMGAARQMYRVVLANSETVPEAFISSTELISTAFEDKNVFFIADKFASGGNAAWINSLEKSLFHSQFALSVSSNYTYTSTSASISAQKVLDLIKDDVDYIVVACGTHDWQRCSWTGAMDGLGDISDTNEMTIYGAINSFVSRIQTRFPNAKLVLVTPPNFSYAGTAFTEGGFCNACTFSTANVAEAIKEIGAKNGVSVIDLNEQCWSRDNISQYVNYAEYSYMNMNEDGNKLIADIMAKELIKLAE